MLPAHTFHNIHQFSFSFLSFPVILLSCVFRLIIFIILNFFIAPGGIIEEDEEEENEDEDAIEMVSFEVKKREGENTDNHDGSADEVVTSEISKADAGDNLPAPRPRVRGYTLQVTAIANYHATDENELSFKTVPLLFIPNQHTDITTPLLSKGR